MQHRLSLSTASTTSASPARPPSPSPAPHATNRVQSSFLAPPPLPSLRRSSSRSLLSPLNTSSSPSSAVSSAPPATPSRPIPISPPSATHPSRAHSTPNSLPQAGGSTNAQRRTHAAPLEPFSHRHRSRRGVDGEEEGEEESEGSFTIPILDTRTLPPLRSSGAPPSTLTSAERGLGAGGRRLSCLASYTGLPLPPSAGAGGAAGGGGEELRYSLASFRSSLGQSQSQGRRPSISGAGGAGSSIARPPSPAPEAFARATVSPLTSGGGAGSAGVAEVKRGRRESVVLGQGSLAALAASGGGSGGVVGGGMGGRRAPSPARQHAQPAQASGLVRSASPHHRQSQSQSQSAARSPSPAPVRGDSPRVVRGFDPPQASSSSGQRAPSPARFVGGGGAGGSTVSAPASSHLSARRASLSSSSTSSPLQARPSSASPTSP